MTQFFKTACFIALAVTSLSASADEVPYGTVYSKEGRVERRKATTTEWQELDVKTAVLVGDTLRTASSSRVAILGNDGLMIRLRPDSLLEIAKSNTTAAPGLKIDQGAAHVLSRDPHIANDITTSQVSGSIRGTEFVAESGPNGSAITVIDGALALNDRGAERIIEGGQEVRADAQGNITTRVVRKSLDSVQWAVRYPTLVSLRTLEPLFVGASAAQQAAVEALMNEDLESAVQRAGSLPADRTTSVIQAGIAWLGGDSPRALGLLGGERADPVEVFRIGLLLETGQVDQARKEIAAFSAKNTPISPRLAGWFQAEGLVLRVLDGGLPPPEVPSGADVNLQSPELWYARSLVAQAHGDMEGALRLVNEALEVEPGNPRLLARRAELLFGSGDNRGAEEASELALRANPHDQDARTVQGFILVARGYHERAREIFQSLTNEGTNRAAAYLGLGLVTMYNGDRDEARMYVQKAVHLDPTSALYRSYLAKAFFETNREHESLHDLKLAKELDPADPTPYLYEAFTDLAIFKPVDALGAVEESIARNDNRAVYRSRLLLDQDNATRASGLGRVFAALDFNKPARIEALKSLAIDPSNYAAHFLLKDSLTGAANNSSFIVEDVTGTLLAPANFSSLLPSVNGAASLNDYSTLFEREQSRTAIEAVTETHDSAFASSVTNFGGSSNASYLLHYGWEYISGYRDNDYLRAHNVRLLTQYAPTLDDKFLLEGITSTNDSGDTVIGLDPDTNDPNLSTSFDDYTGRLGYRRRWSAAHTTIAQGLYISNHSGQRNTMNQRQLDFSQQQNGEELAHFQTDAIYDTTNRQQYEGGRGDIQHMWSGDDFSLITGTSVVGFREHLREGSEFISDPQNVVQDFDLSSRGDVNTGATRGYSYLTLRPNSMLSLIGGAQYARVQYAAPTGSPYNDDTREEVSWLPKAGAILTPGGGFTVRSAYFETLGASSPRDLEGLEPSQIGGIQQTYDDGVGAETRNWGVGLDWKSPKSTYVGSEFLYRNISDPYSQQSLTFVLDPNTPDVTTDLTTSDFTLHSQERIVSSYWNQVLTSTLVSSLTHDWSQADADALDQEIRTHRARLGLNYFQTDGFYAFSSATWRHQDRDNFPDDPSGTSDFWIASGGVGYQLEHRRGFVQLSIRNVFDQGYNYVPVISDDGLRPGTNLQLSVHLNF